MSENGNENGVSRGQWNSRMGFILAAAGSAIGLGNIWKFPYITYENGGGLFVLIYLVCIALIGFPVMIAEIMVGRSTQKSPVGAFKALTHDESPWKMVGWLGVLAGFIILSYYSVVAGWALNYFLMSIGHFFAKMSPEEIQGTFGALIASPDIQIFWHFIFMALTIGVVYGGVKSGIERWSHRLMPVLFIMLIFMMIYIIAFLGGSFWKSIKFMFAPETKLKPSGVLEALGHAFFTLSLGMGTMLTYGSYLSKDTDLPKTSFWVCVADSAIAISACLIIFPILFAFGEGNTGGPGLVFKTMPMLFAKLKGGLLISIIFFLLLAFAALTSAISLLEVVASYFIDELNWSRKKTTLITGTAVFLFGIPSAAGTIVFKNWAKMYGMGFFDTMDHLASNWMLPLGGLLIALFVGWGMKDEVRKQEFGTDSASWLYPAWMFMLRYVAPLLIFIVLLNKIGILDTKMINKAFGVE